MWRDALPEHQMALITSTTPAVSRMCANPVMLSLMREYFGTPDMAYGHTPIVNVMKPVEQVPLS